MRAAQPPIIPAPPATAEASRTDSPDGRGNMKLDATLDPSSRVRLKPTTAKHFTGDTLFDRVARVVCEANCLPRKELYESWEIARRTRRRFRGGRIVDLACGHGLVAHLMLLLDDSSPAALCVDKRIPQSAKQLASAMFRAWPRLESRVVYEERSVEEVELHADDVVVSTHACGALTDLVLKRAVAAQARVAVLPCCHDEDTCDTGGLAGWVDVSLAIDATRARWLVAQGYDVHTQLIPEAITPKNRLLIGEPPRQDRNAAVP
jgi:Methyltransferase domain